MIFCNAPVPMCAHAMAMTTTSSNDNAPASDIVEIDLSVAEHHALLAFKYVGPSQLEALLPRTSTLSIAFATLRRENRRHQCSSLNVSFQDRH
jgi:hypothetical protein